MTSFHTRIRWSSLSLITTLLLIFCAVLYSTLSFLLHDHIDAQLVSIAQLQADQIKKESGEIKEILERRIHFEADHNEHLEEEEHELREAIRDSVVLNRNGAIQWKGEGLGAVPTLDPQLLSQVLAGRIIYDTLPQSHGSHLRRISFPITSQGEVEYILQTHSSLDVVDTTLRWLLLALAIVTIGIFVFGWIGSNWVAHIALSPVEILSQTASNVSAHSLDTRLVMDAPYQEFQQLSQSFNGMLGRLQKVFESQRQFISDAAHELKTPLAAMKGHMEVALQRPRATDEYQETLSASLGQVEHLTRLVKSLLTLTQFAGEHPPVTLQPLLLTPIVKELVAELSILAKEKGCSLKAELQDVRAILGDAGQLKQLVINLLDNAIRHTPQGGSVTVTLHSSASHVQLTIEDTGSGISAEHLPHIFERFYRADPARDRGRGGTGLGLAIAQEIVRAHHGTITVNSAVGTGSAFTVHFPLTNGL